MKFVAFKKPFEECIFTEMLWDIYQATKILKNDIFRIYPISTEKVREEGTEFENEEQKKLKAGKYIGDKWGGKYLRAPDIFFTILTKGKDKLVKLKEVADVRFGIKTGCNEFFYLTDAQVKEWGIEEEFLKPVIKSPRECRTNVIDTDKLQYKIFMCNKSKRDLKNTKALKYIQWGEKLKIRVNLGKDKGKIIIGVNNLSFVKKRKMWWSVEGQQGNTFWGKELRERLVSFTSDEIMLADCRLYCATLSESIQNICNSTLYHLFGETLKRDLGGGGGPRSVMVYEVQNSLIIRPNLIKKNVQRANRKVESIFTECGINPESKVPIEEQEPKPLLDRKKLDDIVFDVLGLTEEERKDVYRAVCRLVWNRISKAKSV